ncbi:cobalamin adenosyltransferase [Bacteroidia bacterium]|nr:cobalamin adenosyltransferase [Bacteroidia bacterium]
MEKSKVYTRTGDEGYTSLAGGKRVPKTHARLEADGTVDELNSFIACLVYEINHSDDLKFLLQIQNELFELGSYLATERNPVCKITQEDVATLEQAMDKIDKELPQLKTFIIPGGSKANALAHVCRTVARRAERNIYRIMEEEPVDSEALKYINRLSDYFFLLARKQNFIEGIDENTWTNSCK